MPAFELYIEDSRYSVPTLYLITVQGDERAREMAEELLLESPHHQAVEVRRDGETLFTLDAVALLVARGGSLDEATGA